MVHTILFGFVPFWFVPSVLDWWWHKKSDIAHQATAMYDGLREARHDQPMLKRPYRFDDVR